MSYLEGSIRRIWPKQNIIWLPKRQTLALERAFLDFHTSFGATIGLSRERVRRGEDSWLAPATSLDPTQRTFHVTDCSVSPVVPLVSLYFCVSLIFHDMGYWLSRSHVSVFATIISSFDLNNCALPRETGVMEK